MKKLSKLLSLKIVSVSIVFLMVFSLMACGNTDQSSSETTASTADTATGSTATDSTATGGTAESTDATSETTETESEIDYEALQTQVEKDWVRIMLIDPVKPDDLGTVNSLNYSGIDFDAPLTTEVTDDDVDDSINEQLTNTLIELDDAQVEEGDTVNIDYEGKMNGETFDGGSDTDYNLQIGSDSFIDGFEDGLIGAKKGDTLDLDLTFPDDYSSEDLAGQAVTFTVTINSISRYLNLEDFDDEVAKKLMDDESATVQSVREDTRADLELDARREAKQTMYNNALSAAMEESDVEANDETIEWQLDLTMISYDDSLKQQGLNLAYYLGYFLGTDYTSFREQMHDTAVEAANEAVLRYAICDAEGLEYNDEGIETYKSEFEYSDEDIEGFNEDELEQAVIWTLSAKTVVEKGNVTYVEETTASTDETTASTDESSSSADEITSSADESSGSETTAGTEESSTQETTARITETSTEETSASE